MRSSNKSRSRNKNNRNRSVGNVVNRVFDSSGPEGKVRGTPQQIIEKYQTLAHDAQLSNDPVAAENFQQHAEHYTRMLNEAQREMAERQAANDQRNRDQQQKQQQQQQAQPAEDAPSAEKAPASNGHDRAPAESSLAEVDFLNTDESGLVETPESSTASAEETTPPPRKRRSSRAKATSEESDPAPAAE